MRTSQTRPVIAIDGRCGLRAPRYGAGEYVYHLITELGFMSRPYDLHVFGDLTADPDVLRRIRFIHPVDLLITPNAATWEQMAFPQAAHGAALMHGTANGNALTSRIPGVLTVVDLADWHRSGPVPLTQQAARTYRTTAMKLLLRRSTAIFTLSEATKQELVSTFNVPADRLVVTPPAPTMAISEPIFPKDPYFLAVAHAGNRAALWAVLDVFKRANLSEYRLKFMADTPRTADVVRHMAHLYGLDGQADVLERGSAEERMFLYQRATAFLHLPIYEGSGLPVMDALALGAPIIAANIPAISEVTGSAAILVNPDDADEAAQAMRRIAEHTDVQHDLAIQGQERARQYQWKHTAEKTHQTYLKLLESRHLI